MSDITPFQKKRLEFQPVLPDILNNILSLSLKEIQDSQNIKDDEDLKEIFKKSFNKPIYEIILSNEKTFEPKRVGVVFSGGQAPGGHNVISGLYDALKKLNPKSILYGFLNGPSGVIDAQYVEIEKDMIDLYRNQGGFDLIGSGRTKIETEDQLNASEKCVNDLNLDGLVIIGGDDSNTNAAILAEYFLQHDCKTRVIGVPKTIDGDLRNEHIEISFGFDTATKVYSELIGNIQRDALSAKKYYHFIRVMGRSASHIALECALKTHPNLTIIAEEVKEKKKTMLQITKEIADVIVKRHDMDKNYGVILIPEGLIEFIPEMKILIQELNDLLAEKKQTFDDISSFEDKMSFLKALLSKESLACFDALPTTIQLQLLLDRDPHGNVQVSKIETEKLFMELVKNELKNRSFKGKFNAISHFFGYEGRSGFPTNFDAQYCYALGHVAAILINEGLTGYMSCIYDVIQPVQNWKAKGVPLSCMLNIEKRHGKNKPVIKKALVDLNSVAFKHFEKIRKSLETDDLYLYPGSIQFFGDKEITDSIPIFLTIKDIPKK